MGQSKQYLCSCGKLFYTPQSFNGHKSNCVEHLIMSGKIKSKEEWLLQKKAQNKQAIEARRTNVLTRKEQSLDSWISEKHTCEKCGKIMTEKYGSGRFCSRSCANSRTVTASHRQKTSTTLKNIWADPSNSYTTRLTKLQEAYAKEPSVCQICKKPLAYLKRFNTLCGDPACQSLHLSQALTKAHSEGRHPNFKYHNEESYPEKYFKQVLLNNQINFKSQVPIFNGKNYFHLDFELDYKIDLEIDGRLHEDPKQMEYDKWRDSVMISKGYKVYRFKWIDPKKEDQMQLKIKEFLDWYYENSGVV